MRQFFEPGDYWKKIEARADVLFVVTSDSSPRYPGQVRIYRLSGCMKGPWEYRYPFDTGGFWLFSRNGQFFDPPRQ